MLKRVLVAEDNALVRDLLVRLLRNSGHTVVAVGDGQSAWDVIKRGAEFDIIMSDYEMPEMDGIELLHHVRAHARMANVPFVLMSGDIIVSEEDPIPLRDVCAQLKATFCPKPCDYRLIIAEFVDREKETSRPRRVGRES